MAVAGCRGLVLATLLAIVTCSSGQTTTVIHTIYWTRESVQQYSTDSPLRVRQGEIVVFNCTMANNTDSQAITRLNDSRQFDNCSCNAAPELSCTGTQLIASRCLPGFPTVSITINRNSGPLASVLDYVPGQTYYLTSFPVTFVGGFPSSAESGGACEPSADGPGLKMVMVVLSSDPEDTTANPLATLSSTEAPMNTQVPGSTMQTQMPAGSSEQPTLGNGGGTILLVEGLNASTVSNIVVISGAVVGAAAAVLIAAVLACGILFIIYQAHRRRKEWEETPEVAEDGYELPRNRQDAVLSQSLNEYVADPVLQNTLSPLTAMSAGGGSSQETSQLKPENSDLKLDLSLSQSFQQYEVMDAVLRNSQSSLLAVIERSEAEESVEEKELKEEEQEGKEEVEEKKEDGRKGSDECGDTDSQERKSTSSNKTEEKTHRILPTPAEKSRPTMLKLISIDESSDSTPKCVPISASPRKEPLSSQSSICSFTGFAQARFLESSDKVPTTDRDQVMPGNEVEENKDAVQEPLSPVFEEAPDNKKPPKPAPAPRKARPGPSTSSTEDTLLEVTARAGATQEATPTGEYSSTTYPRSSKPKPKPRAAKRSESGVKGDEVDPEASTPSKDAAEKSGLV